jgi:hypothetical protein
MKAKRLLGSWRLWAIAAVVAAIFMFLALWARSGSPDRILTERRGANGELTRDQVERLLACVERDQANDDKRTRWYGHARGPRVVRDAFDRVVEAAFPNRNTDAKFAHAGRAASGALLAVVLDPSETLTRRETAAYTAATIDPYKMLQAIQQPIASERVPGPFALKIAFYCLPHGTNRPVSAYSSQNHVSDSAWKNVDTICLEWLDVKVGSADLMPNDWTILWWLNRYRGMDLDDWLAKQAPEVLAFRRKEIDRGCDPIRLVFWVGNGEEYLVRSLYPNETDQSAMERLCRIFCSQSTPREGDWNATLRQWYKANRSRLVYDTKKMHFVVGPAPVRAEVKVESTWAPARPAGLIRGID